ncbi:ABC transporter substrate-binding protein [Candidatus Albibeggiatoa sp. nov. NOAA]|uniref:MlaC/ttg2D family ABC transporter substrate-binding protein n=1 Tax=Candidatus Albibeggiatoa sp. nov. NOAA TaxID=3162724 RepID=UPI0032F4B2CF|nr:ABC transporter substrate-binding protein [Thiotrichaceae bacterium]
MKLFKYTTFLFLTLFIGQSVSAQGTEPADAKALIEATTNQVLAAIQENAEDPLSVAQEHVLPHFDFVAMSRLVVGKNWKSATKAQKKEFVQAFRDLLIRTYANTLIEAAKSDVSVEYLPVRAKEGAKRVKVQTLVKYNGNTVKLDYSLRTKKGSWKVWDVSAGGVSLVTNYRAEFQKIFKEKGMDGLIETVNAKNSGE